MFVAQTNKYLAKCNTAFTGWPDLDLCGLHLTSVNTSVNLDNIDVLYLEDGNVYRSVLKKNRNYVVFLVLLFLQRKQ